jgi:hypothetical protein
LGERLHGMQEVIGSSPLSSTKSPIWTMIQVGFFHALLFCRQATEIRIWS